MSEVLNIFIQTEDKIMLADFTDFCTWAYVVISDTYQQLAPATHRPGPAAACSDEELLTMALVGECRGWHQETDLLSHWQDYRSLFPHQPDRTRFNRRRRALAPVLNALRQMLVATLDLAQDAQCVMDSLPVPVVQFYHVPRASQEWRCHQATYGKCCAKKQTIFGYKLHLLITLGGVIRDFELAPANQTDLVVGEELLRSHQGLRVQGDKGYISAEVQQRLKQNCDIDLLTLPRRNQRQQVPTVVRHTFNAIRQIIETVNSQLAQQFGIETNTAHSFEGVCARLYTKLTAHTLCMVINRLLGAHDCLHIKHLAFPHN